MKNISLINHCKGALGLRFFGLGPNLQPTNGLIKLQKLLDTNAFWAKNRTINDLKKCLAKSDVVISLWVGKEIVGFGRALTDGIYRGIRGISDITFVIFLSLKWAHILLNQTN